jgi:hypothetical protein
MSTLKVTTISNIDGTKTATSSNIVDGYAKAWVNFNGTATVAIRSSFNVSSITDNGGNGDYSVNFTNAIADTNYVVIPFGASESSLVGQCATVQLKTQSSVRIFFLSAINGFGSWGGYALTDCNVAIFR